MKRTASQEFKSARDKSEHLNASYMTRNMFT